MSETFFPINDLLRRKFQTGLTAVSLTCIVASTLFLLLFSERIGLVFAGTEETLTIGLSMVFSQLILFVGILTFVVGAVLVSFIAFLTMKQRTKDLGLIKAAGCPNNLVFSYFLTELLLIVFVGDTLGLLVGFSVDFLASNLTILTVRQGPPDFWFALIVFAVFFLLALTFGIKPILDAARLTPSQALSSVQYYGLATGGRFKPFSSSWITGKIATRSLSRRSNTTMRIIVLLSAVFILLTVSIAGSVIAKDTTMSWIEKTAGNDVLVVANKQLVTEYERLQAQFSGVDENKDMFDFLNGTFIIPNETIQQLAALPGVVKVDKRLIVKEHIYEVSNFTIDPETMATIPVGDKREGDSIIFGVEPPNVTSSWFLQGRFLEDEDLLEAVIGDSIAIKMFSQPLVQCFRLNNQTLNIVGVCVDPINNGNVAYVPLRKLQEIIGVSGSNIVFLQIDQSLDNPEGLNSIQNRIESTDLNLTVVRMESIIEGSNAFLGSAWSIVALLPLFTLASASLCLVAYVMLSIDEQRQEFMILRAVGAKPKTIVAIVGLQNSLVMAASLVFGLSFGVIGTLLILVPHPVISGFTVLYIGFWLAVAAAAMFLVSLAPSIKLARTSLQRIMT